MADISSAGTLVGAALQTAGLASQEQILVDFQAFFQSAGGLLYLIAGVGGIISVVLFGSYRMARYLLVGPVLFWFLVGVHTQHRGVQWKLGDGTARDFRGLTSEEESAATMRNVDAHTRTAQDGRPVLESFRVAWTFSWFTILIDDFVNQTVGALLHFEDDDDLLFISRTRALKLLTASSVQDAQIIEMIQGRFSRECHQMLGASFALASPDVDSYTLDNTIQVSRNEGVDTSELSDLTDIQDAIRRKRTAYEAEYARTRLKQLNPDNATFGYMRDHSSDIRSVTAAILSRTGQTLTGNGTGMVITCDDNWNLIVEAIVQHADKLLPRLLEDQAVREADAGRTEVSAARLCNAMAVKLVGDGVTELHRAANADDIRGYECPLVPVAAMYMIRNALVGTNARSSMIQRHWNQMQLMSSSKPSDSLIPVTPDHMNLSLAGQGGRKGTIYNHKTRYNRANRQVEVAYYEKAGKTDKEQWHPVARVGKVRGHADTTWGEHQTYLSRGLRQRIFQTAMQMPYYQGMILYFLSIAYPFLALVVILPSHAKNFFYLPLAWLWVKSWDIGFALVMVLEKVLWNMLPQADLELGFATVEGLHGVPVPDVLQQAMKVDPSHHLHAYYFMIGIVMFAIPNITGYAILRTKASVLSSFTNGMRRMGKESQDKAESAYGIARISGKQQSIVARQGVAMMANSRGMSLARGINATNPAAAAKGAAGITAVAGTLFNDLSEDSKQWGLMSQAAQSGLSGFSSAVGGGGNPGRMRRMMRSTLSTAGSGFVQKANALQTYDAAYQAEHQAVFDRKLGAFGAWNIIARAGLSAQEAQQNEDPFSDTPPSGFIGGFDTGDLDRTTQATSAAIDLHYQRWRMLISSAVNGTAQQGSGYRGPFRLSGDNATAREAGRTFMRNFFGGVVDGYIAAETHFSKDSWFDEEKDFIDDMIEKKQNYMNQNVHSPERSGRIARRVVVDDQTLREDLQDQVDEVETDG